MVKDISFVNVVKKIVVLFLTFIIIDSTKATTGFELTERYIIEGQVDSAILLLEELTFDQEDTAYASLLFDLVHDTPNSNYTTQYQFILAILENYPLQSVMKYVNRDVVSLNDCKLYSRDYFNIYNKLMVYLLNDGKVAEANELYVQLKRYTDRVKTEITEKEDLWINIALSAHQVLFSYISEDYEKGYEIAKKAERDARIIGDTSLILQGLFTQCNYFRSKGDIDQFIAVSEECNMLNNLYGGTSIYTTPIKVNLVNAYIFKKDSLDKVNQLIDELYTGKETRSLTYMLYAQSISLFKPGSKKRSEIYRKFGVDDIVSFSDTLWARGDKELLLLPKRNLLEIIVVQLKEAELYKSALKYEQILRNVNETIYSKDMKSAVSDFKLKLDMKDADLAMQALENNSRKVKFWWMVSITLLGLFFGILFVAYLTNKKQKAILQKSYTKLEHLNSIRSKFFNNVAHELRTPLTLITSPLDHVLYKENENYSSEVRSHIKLARNTASKLHNKVEDFLKLSALEDSRITVNPGYYEVGKVIREIAEPFVLQASQKSIELLVETDLTGKDKFGLDKVHFETILNNLLSNAVKHSPKNSKIILSCKKKAESLLIQVVDSGAGITESEIKQIFDTYFQTTDGEKIGGFGIGLSLSKELTEIMGGKLSVNSIPFQRTTFSLELPPLEVKYPNQKGLNATFENVLANTRFGFRPNLLIIEDDPDMINYLYSVLNQDFKIYKAFSADEAISILEKNTIHIITTDLIMNNISGKELVITLKSKQRWSDIPVVVISAKNSVKEKLELFELAISDYLVKPFNSAELRARLLNLVKKEPRKASSKKENSAIKDTDELWLKNLKEYIEKELSDEKLKVPDIAEQFDMTERTLRRKLKELIGMSPSLFLKELRLTRAHDLLAGNAYNSVKEVAFACGFSRADVFTREFKKRYGKLPNEFEN